MQLHPFFATISRPVYMDRQGYPFIEVDCPGCRGEGEVPYSSINPSEKDGMQSCDCCNGTGRVYEQACEEDLNPVKDDA